MKLSRPERSRLADCSAQTGLADPCELGIMHQCSAAVPPLCVPCSDSYS